MLNTAVERVDLFNLHPMVAINLRCMRMSRVPWNFGGGPLIVRPR